jgi:hypothetical protein
MPDSPEPNPIPTAAPAPRSTDSPRPLRETFGFIYSATGEKFVREAAESARSVRRCMPNAGLAISTDLPDLAGSPRLFDHVLPIPPDKTRFGMKFVGMIQTPFEKTVFLDTDTYMLDAVYELIPLLDRYELACAHEVARFNEPVRDVPASFPEPNTGVIAFRNTPEVLAFLKRVHQKYLELHPPDSLEKRPGSDQGPFRDCLFHSELRNFVLPSEYNLRAYAPYFAGSRVKILHCRGKYLKRAMAKANRVPRMRVGDGKNWIERGIFDLKQALKARLPKKYMKNTPTTWEMLEHRSQDVSHYRDLP